MANSQEPTDFDTQSCVKQFLQFGKILSRPELQLEEVSRSAVPISVCGAIAANLLIATTKFVVAAISGSASMLSEGIHSLADTGNELLLLIGIWRSKKPADDDHAFGHGTELYFWSLIVAILLFAFGGGISVYEGILHLRNPASLSNPFWNYLVLAIAACIESVSLTIAIREMRKRQPGKPLLRALHDSKDPSIFVVIFEDAAAIIGLLIAFMAILLAHLFNEPSWDAIGSISIGLLLASVSAVLTYECRGLLLGESADPKTIENIRKIAENDSEVIASRYPMTMHLGPDEVLLALDLVFLPELNSAEIAIAIERLEASIQALHPEIEHIYIAVRALKTQTD